MPSWEGASAQHVYKAPASPAGLAEGAADAMQPQGEQKQGIFMFQAKAALYCGLEYRKVGCEELGTSREEM